MPIVTQLAQTTECTQDCHRIYNMRRPTLRWRLASTPPKYTVLAFTALQVHHSLSQALRSSQIQTQYHNTSTSCRNEVAKQTHTHTHPSTNRPDRTTVATHSTHRLRSYSHHTLLYEASSPHSMSPDVTAHPHRHYSRTSPRAPFLLARAPGFSRRQPAGSHGNSPRVLTATAMAAEALAAEAMAADPDALRVAS